MSKRVISTRVRVYITSDEGPVNDSSSRYEKLKSLFSDPVFHVEDSNKLIEHPSSQKTFSYPKGTNPKYESEAKKFMSCLHDSKEKDKDHASHTFVIKLNSITNMNSESLASHMKAFCQDDFHLYYLCKWLDRCDLYSNKKVVAGGFGMVISAVSQSPQGLQAILVSPSGRDMILGHAKLKNGHSFDVTEAPMSQNLTRHVAEGGFETLVTLPNIFDFDISSTKKSSDYRKLAQCAEVEGQQRDTKDVLNQQPDNVDTSSSSSSGWGLLIIALIIIVAFLFLFMRR